MFGWTRRTLPAKNTVTSDDARVLENAFEAKMSSFAGDQKHACTAAQMPEATVLKKDESEAAEGPAKSTDRGVAFPKPRCLRNKGHLAFVSRQACLVCGRIPPTLITSGLRMRPPWGAR
jgi:hypothetical protein